MNSHLRRPPKNLREQWQLIRRMFRFMLPVTFHTAVLGFVLAAFIIVEIKTVTAVGPAVDAVKSMTTGTDAPPTGVWDWLSATDGSGAELRDALLWLAGFQVVYSFFAWAREVTKSWHSMSMVFFIRAAVYDRLQRVGFGFYDQYSTGQLINRAISDLQAVRNFVQEGFRAFIEISISVVGYSAFILYSSPELAIVVLAPLPLWFWAIRKFAVKSQPIYEKQMLASDEIVRQLTENIAGVHVVRAFATEPQERKRFGGALDALLNHKFEGINLQARWTPTIRGIATLTHIGLFALTATLVNDGQLPLSSLVVFGMAMNRILGRVQEINAISDAYQNAVVSSGRLYEILDTPDTTPERADAEPLRPGAGAVRFSHVSFSYEPGKPVLEDVSFTAPAGSVIAVVGPTGSGKTTLSALLARFYDVDLGAVEIDGQDVREVTLQSVRDAVGYVFQETYLFSDTVCRNIAYSDLNAPREKIKEAARIARADEFIERLQDKYDTMIGEYGASLSGGQKQRLAIARAILHNPRILVLDDSLSAVDPETEAQIRAGLHRIMRGRTVFLITSRISTARRADKIIVLEGGKVTQIGTHKELSEKPGYYREVMSCQFSDDGAHQASSHMDRMNRITRSGRLVTDEEDV